MYMRYCNLRYFFIVCFLQGSLFQASESFTVKGYHNSEAQRTLKEKEDRLEKIQGALHLFKLKIKEYKQHKTALTQNALFDYIQMLKNDGILDDVMLSRLYDLDPYITFINDFEILQNVISNVQNLEQMWLAKSRQNNWNILHLLVNLYRLESLDFQKKFNFESYIVDLFEKYPTEFKKLLFVKNTSNFSPLEMMKTEPLFFKILPKADFSKIPVDVLAPILHTLFGKEFQNVINPRYFNEIMSIINEKCPAEVLTDALSFQIQNSNGISRAVISYLNKSLYEN